MNKQLPGIDGNKSQSFSRIVNYVTFNVSAAGATDYQIPFHVADPSKLTIRFVPNLLSNVLAHALQMIPTSLLSAALKVVPDNADHTKDYTISYDFDLNKVTVTPGTVTASGMLQVLLYDRVLLRSDVLVDPGTTNPATLPFAILDYSKTWLGCNLQYQPNPGLFINSPVTDASANSWHISGYLNSGASIELVRILSKNTFQRDTTALTSDSFYLLEFQ